MIEIYIADDHPLVREGLKKVVNQSTIDIKVGQEFTNADELLLGLQKKQPDIVILDVAMPGKSGLDALKEIKDFYPSLPVLILSMHPEDRFAIRALKAGASGYLNKSSISEQMVNAIRRIVVEKKKYISQTVAEQLAEQVDFNNEGPLHESLSDREFQILCLIASGKKVNTIAEELSLSVQTVHTYRSRIKDKMNLKSNVEITRYAITHGLID
ncbi:MAG: response regulator transcription factor [Balneola sp.]|nr:response regulator transcription factor [Balneola sp.]MBO6650924.1 response regulator transcription factor [Balneola sp.]MBO6711866.1 response regulator transcription factor [Balneola sp.]MBO6800061.1 response regulator transcription factor [Balneola sp.]MBO6871558.1 response regulator transcription factor [Balneola sp.]